MGLVYVDATVTGPSGRSEDVHFLVDSGAKYSLLPRVVWRRLGLKAKRDLTFTLVDGTRIKRKVGECHFRLEGVDNHSPVILGERQDEEALLGVVTLENLGLVLNPFDRTLRPMRTVLV